MTERLVRLKGHLFDLEELSNHFTSADLNVRKDGDGYYYLRSSDFAAMNDSSAVEKRGRELLEYVNGIAKLLLGPGYRAVQFDASTRIEKDGQRFHTVGSSITFSARSRVTAKPTVVRSDGIEEEVQPSIRAEAIAELADRNTKVADALRFQERDDWFNLYKAWEIVCDAAGGSHAVVRNGWAVELDRRRFTGTAQSREELGDEARHASEKYKPPKDPMSPNEARAFVRSVIEAWISTL